MDCREARDLLQDELDGRLAPSDEARLAEHVGGCAACADEKRALASLRDTFRAMQKSAAPAGFRDAVMERLPKGRVRSLPRMLGLLVAAAAVVVVAITIIPSRHAVKERAVATAHPWGEAGPPAASPSPAPVREREGVFSERRRDAAPSKATEQEAADDARAADLDEVKIDTVKSEQNVEPPKAPEAPQPGADAAAKAPESAAARKEVGAAESKKDEPAVELSKVAEFKRSERQSAAPTVRYVVFRDAAVAERFAAELAAALPDVLGDKKREADQGGGGGGGTAGGGAAANREGADRLQGFTASAEAVPMDERRVLADAQQTTRRVVSRAPLPAALDETRLLEKVRGAGGALVPVDESDRMAVLLTTRTRVAREVTSDDGESGGKSKDRGAAPPAEPAPQPKSPAPPATSGPVPGRPLPPPGAKPSAEKPTARVGAPSEAVPPPNVVLVIVVIGEPEPAAGEKR